MTNAADARLKPAAGADNRVPSRYRNRGLVLALIGSVPFAGSEGSAQAAAQVADQRPVVAHMGTNNRTISRQRLGDGMLWTGLIVAGISMWSFGLFSIYLSLEGTFSAAQPQPTKIVTIALASFTVGILLSLGGLVLLRGMRHRALQAATQSPPDTEVSEPMAAV